jgi:hypothetical protein
MERRRRQWQREKIHEYPLSEREREEMVATMESFSRYRWWAEE